MRASKAIPAPRQRALSTDKIITLALHGLAGAVLLLLLAFVGHIAWNALSDFKLELLAFSPTGIGNQLFNTVYLVFLALVISVPLGIGGGIYMAEYATKGRAQRIMRISIETLSSLPSIVLGLFGYLVFIIMTSSQWNLFAGALTVSILTLPLIATITEDALRALPPSYAKGSYGLGATKWQTISRVLLPAAFPAIITGIILAAGRVFGEAAALMFTAGMSTDINWASTDITSPTNAFNPFRSGETLALQIWASRSESLASDAEAMANLSALLLLTLVFTFSIGARALSRHLNRKNLGENK
ncbi:phosphate ABC transporter permease PstA [Veillonella sp. R32]|uniref:phosphate ABC transporter permease PstA n=1 Tax=Veillonella sp. R32 TaxID=2021312 RepID=UPI001389CB0B|nr:phosphate ABC transporter permease PstA [Veillonella sp. R32]KAF1683117.1 phosphate ABC transporter, permease protein PstA [Veillonella sp. R32]